MDTKLVSEWVQTLRGWQWGDYLIERVGPHLWVLTRTVDTGRSRSPSLPGIVATSASLQTLKRLAERTEAKKRRIRHAWVHGLGAVAALLAMAFALSLPPIALVISTILLLTLFVRSVCMLVTDVTGAAWKRVRQTYQ